LGPGIDARLMLTAAMLDPGTYNAAVWRQGFNSESYNMLYLIEVSYLNVDVITLHRASRDGGSAARGACRPEGTVKRA